MWDDIFAGLGVNCETCINFIRAKISCIFFSWNTCGYFLEARHLDVQWTESLIGL